MIRAIIIDDEQNGINSLKLLIEKFINGVKVIAATTDPEAGVVMVDDYHPDVVFLDINMPVISGFELLQRVNYKGFYLVFTTAHEEFALQAIKIKAIDYLLKPIDKDDLKTAVNKIRNQIQEKAQPDYAEILNKVSVASSQTRIPISSKDEIIYEQMENIIRLEADSNYTRIFLKTRSVHVVPKTLKEYEKILCEESNHFMRVHQSHIINLTQVARFIKEDGGLVVMKDNSEIPLSKQKKDEFLKWLGV